MPTSVMKSAPSPKAVDEPLRAEAAKDVGEKAFEPAKVPAVDPLIAGAEASSTRSRSARAFSAAELNRLAARLEAALFLMGLEALAAKESDGSIAPSSETRAAGEAGAAGAAGTAGTAGTAGPAGTTGATAAGPAVDRSKERVRVVARFATIDAELERALQTMAIEIEARGSSRHTGVLILRVPRERLIDLGLLESTRRVEVMPEVVAAGK